ncbi:hypothetical protein MVEN_01896100 [Mycena venus]|uniref:YMC020W-like alpha/beta hydrolase domain-containing protein n=1 Tax=Mycena venus TaxID=2733690 RepID=A0A8H6XFZ6_9AGAR|nr:hypothetical protein MVEN_01896100 [Mycena venus]
MSALDTSPTTESSPQQKPHRRSRHPSTSSIRSAASTRSPRPSVWRPPNSLRIRRDSTLSSGTDPRLSCVVAGAEMSATTGNVRDRMEAFNVATVPAAGPSSPTPSATNDLPPTYDPPHEIPVIQEVESDTSSTTLATPADPTPDPADGSNVVAFPVAVSPPTTRASSWFGSLSRAKGKEKLVEVQAAATASAPNLLSPSPASSATVPIPVPSAEVPSVSEPVTSSNSAAPERADPFLAAADGAQAHSAPSQSLAAQKAALAKRSWFSSSPSQPSPLRAASPPQPIPHPIQIPSAAAEDGSVPSSLDSSVPTPVATPPADTTVSFPLSDAVLSNDGDGGTVRGRQRLSSLNPSTGRFGIHLPLLGGSRAAAATTTMGTEDTTQVSTADGTITTTHTSETSETVTQDAKRIVKTDTLQTTSVSTTTNASDAADSTPQTTNMNEVRTEQHSSWWDYVGWGAATPQPQSTTQDKSQEEGEVTPKPHQKPFPEVSDAPLPESATSPSSDDDGTKTVGPGSPPVITVSHEEQQQASWLYPWAWYGGSTTSTSTTTTAPASEDSSNEEKPKDAEQTEAAAEPVPESAPVDPSPPSPSATESEATAAQQRYWTSFFTSSYSQPATGSRSGPTSPVQAAKPLPAETSTASTHSAAAAAAASPEPELRQATSSLSLNSNPIGDSINSNRSGWVSFLASGTLGYVSRKPITSGEPEVMEVDFDEEGATGEAPAVAPQAAASQNEALDKNKKETPKKEAPKKLLDGKASKEEVPPQPNGTAPATKPTPAKPAAEKKQTAPPLTISDSVKRQVANNSSTGSISSKRASSPSPSVASKASGTKTPSKAPSIAPPRSPVPNLVLPTWGDTFHAPPRSVVPQRLLDHGKTVGRAVMEKTMRFVSGVLFAADTPTMKRRSSSANPGKGKGKDRGEREREKRFEEWGLSLPRAWDVLKPSVGKGESGEMKEGNVQDVLRGAKNVVVIGIHGWFPGAIIQSVLGEPTGTSTKFSNMMVTALEEFQSTYNVSLEKITRIPLEGEGTIDRRVDKLYTALNANAEWMTAIHEADVIFVATHSQGTIVSTHVLDRLIRDGHIRTGGSDVSKDPGSIATAAASTATASALPAPPPQRVCCLALCGIHLGPLRYLSSSSLLLPYIQYFENAAAKELFEFQNTESEVSKAYVNALRNVVDNGTKMVYVASLNDQVVPIYSGLFTSASHPLILRALYIDGDAYHSSDFLSNLLVLLIRVLNAGLPDSGLIAHLSEATAGSLNGVGHSTGTSTRSRLFIPWYFCFIVSLNTSLMSSTVQAVKYLFLTNSGFDTHPKLTVEPFNAATEQNDYEIPWSLRDLIADERVAHFFSKEITSLASAFRHWHPKTTILRDIKRKLQPIQRLPPSFTAPANDASASNTSVSKL